MRVDDEEKKYKVFLDDLTAGDACRWGVYDFEFDVDGGRRNKLTFISWSVPLVNRRFWR